MLNMSLYYILYHYIATFQQHVYKKDGSEITSSVVIFVWFRDRNNLDALPTTAYAIILNSIIYDSENNPLKYPR